MADIEQLIQNQINIAQVQINLTKTVHNLATAINHYPNLDFQVKSNLSRISNDLAVIEKMAREDMKRIQSMKNENL